ncbi:hypothetical protein EVA_09938 [gut metagenome]|uniref:Uncharacterized protein n=1 Tax=gut metagenome TaxID=749906 RepID=J9CP92_9ZZZZ
MTVANGHRRITMLLLHHQLRHRFAHNIGTAQHHTLLSAHGDVVTLEQFENAQGRCRDIAWETDGQTTYIDGMETIHILAVVDRLDDALLVDMLRQRQLHNKAVHFVVVIQAVDTSQEFFLRNVALVANQRRLETAGLACQHFIAHIGLATSIMPDQDGR